MFSLFVIIKCDNYKKYFCKNMCRAFKTTEFKEVGQLFLSLKSLYHRNRWAANNITNKHQISVITLIWNTQCTCLVTRLATYNYSNLYRSRVITTNALKFVLLFASSALPSCSNITNWNNAKARIKPCLGGKS